MSSPSAATHLSRKAGIMRVPASTATYGSTREATALKRVLGHVISDSIPIRDSSLTVRGFS